jgi:hypothetical protein
VVGITTSGRNARDRKTDPRGTRVADVTVVERRLVDEFSASIPPDEVRRCIADVAARFDAAPVQTYLPVLVERIARNWLRDAVLEADQRPRTLSTLERANGHH